MWVNCSVSLIFSYVLAVPLKAQCLRNVARPRKYSYSLPQAVRGSFVDEKKRRNLRITSRLLACVVFWYNVHRLTRKDIFFMVLPNTLLMEKNTLFCLQDSNYASTYLAVWAVIEENTELKALYGSH